MAIGLLKKILIGLIVALLLVLVAFGSYQFFLRSENGSDQNDSGLNGLPAKIKSISNRAPLGVVIDGNKVKYYSQSDGRVYQSDFKGENLEKISDTIISGLFKVWWSPGKDKVITALKQDLIIEKYYYDYQINQAKKLDYNIRDLDWSPSGGQIAYQYYNPNTEANNISIAQPDGSNWQKIIDIRMNDLIVEWVNDNLIALRNRPSNQEMGAVYTLELKTKEFKKVVNNTYGLSALWSPKGDKLIFSETDSQGQKPRLKFVDLSDQSIQQLNFFTLPEKCVWSRDNRTLFCAAPRTIPGTAKLPDDYYNQQVAFEDNFWKINLATQEITEIYQAKENDAQFYDGENLRLPVMEDYLIFVNRKDGLLYSLDL